MRRLILLVILLLSIDAFAQIPTFDWVTTNQARRGLDLVASPDGNVYSVGRRSTSSSDFCFIRKYDQEGNLEWDALIGAPNFQTGNAEGLYIRIDAEENVYVLGNFDGIVDFDVSANTALATSAGVDDIFLVKYNTSGEYQWHVHFGDNQYDIAGGLAIDGNDNIVIAGRYTGTVDFDPGIGTETVTATGPNAFVLKLDNQGGFISFIDIDNNSESGSVFEVKGLDTDSENNIYVSGRFSGIVDFDPDDEGEAILEELDFISDVYLLKLSSELTFIWVRGFLSTIQISVNDISCTPLGEIVILGSFQGQMDLNPEPDNSEIAISNAQGFDQFVVKLNENGAYLWGGVNETNSSNKMYPSKLDTDIFGDVYVHGTFSGFIDFDPGPGTFNLSAPGTSRVIYCQKLSSIDANMIFTIRVVNSNSILGGGIFVSQTGEIYQNGITSSGGSGSTLDFNPGPANSATPFMGSSTGIIWKLSQCFPTFSEISVEECDSFISPDGDIIYLESGTYIATVQNSAGCDSIITINLTILESTATLLTESACTSFAWALSGATYTESGSYEFTLENAAGCDSLVTLNLTIHQAYEIAETITACESYFWESTGQNLTTSATYQASFLTIYGCDSLRTLELTITENSESEIDVFACDAYESPSGQFTYAESGTYTDVILNSAGCDSIITIELDLGQSTSASLTSTNCFSYTSSSGVEYVDSGTYTEVFVNTQGCDSTLTLDLTIHQVDVTVENAANTLTVLQNDAEYQWLDCSNEFALIADATDQSFTPLENGSYAVEVITEFCADTSECILINSVNVLNNTFNHEITLYPNPTPDQIFLTLSRDIPNATVSVYSTTGQLLDQFNGNLYSGMLLPLSPELSGLLLVVIEGEGKQAVFRVTKLE